MGASGAGGVLKSGCVFLRLGLGDLVIKAPDESYRYSGARPEVGFPGTPRPQAEP